MTQKMSIHRALAEIKAYDDRICTASSATFITANKKGNDKIAGKTIAEVKSSIQGNLDSVKALIENKKKLKAAVVLSNASTIVEIGNKTYTIAEAIERKNMIMLEEMLLKNLEKQYTVAVNRVKDENETLPIKLENYLSSILGDKDKRTVEDIKAHTELFMKQHEFELIDPVDLAKVINELREEITTFKTEVDFKLSESNATTFVEVDLCS